MINLCILEKIAISQSGTFSWLFDILLPRKRQEKLHYQISEIIILTPPIVIPSIRAMYGFLHPPTRQNTWCKWAKIHFTLLNLLKLNTRQHLPMALLRMYSSRKKSSARASPVFPASVTAESLKKKKNSHKDVKSNTVGGSCLKTHSGDWTPRCSPLMSPPAQKAFPPAPLMITMAVSLSSSHFYFEREERGRIWRKPSLKTHLAVINGIVKQVSALII